MDSECRARPTLGIDAGGSKSGPDPSSIQAVGLVRLEIRSRTPRAGTGVLGRLDTGGGHPQNARMPSFQLSLGASVGDRHASLAEAIRRLEQAGLTLTRVSSLYETEPVGEVAGPGWYLNLAASGETTLGPREVLDTCLAVERAMGRGRAVAGGPRSIDIDLLMLGDAIVRERDCEVPHPRMHLRRFVLEPLAEIAPDARHPLLGLSVRELLARLEDGARVARLADPGTGGFARGTADTAKSALVLRACSDHG